MPLERKPGHRFVVAALFLVVALLATVDLTESLPSLSELVASPLFPFLHETHDVLALLVALYAANRTGPRVAQWVVAWIVALHLPYFAVEVPAELPEMARFVLVVVAALAGISFIERQIATAGRNARLYAEAHRRAQELDALRATMSDVLGERELSGLLQGVLKRAVTLVEATGGDLATYDPARREMVIVASHNMGKDYTGTRMALGEGAMGCVAETRQPLVIPEYAAWSGRSQQYAAGPWHAVMAVPLLAADQLVGAIGLVHSEPGRPFTDSDLNLLNLFAQQAAIAIEHSQLYEEAQRLATTDGLTGLNNLRHFLELARGEFARARRYGRPLAVVMLDIDRFKAVNDLHGHAAGDQVLEELAKRLSESVREVDIPARYGGEEFVVLLPETGLAGALQSAERLRQRVAAAPVAAAVGPVAVTVSLGVAALAAETSDFSDLLNQADMALYAAKRAGRNQVSGAGDG